MSSKVLFSVCTFVLLCILAFFETPKTSAQEKPVFVSCRSLSKISTYQRMTAILILLRIKSASRQDLPKTWKFIIKCQNVLQWRRTVTQSLCSIIILSVSELSQPTHCRLEWQFSQLTYCSVKDTVAPIHRIIASIVIFGNVFQMNYNFIFTGRKSVCRENRPILW